MTLTPRLFLLISLLFSLSAGLAGRTSAAPPPDLLAPGGWNLSSPHPGDAKLETVTLPDAPAGASPVQRVTITTPAEPFYMIQIIRNIPAVLPAGHRVRLHFWARSAMGNPMRATVERNGPPYNATAEQTVTLTPSWQEFSVEGVAPEYALSAHFQMGQQAGTVEIGGATVTDTGVDPSVALARAAIAPAATQARIEKYRKGALTVRVVDKEGRPVPNAAVRVTQTRHAFLFGCNFFGLNPADTSPAQKAYQDQFTGLFNYATLPFYWGAFESQQGKPDYARLQTMAQWCVGHGITPKGHPLVWHEVWPDWAPATADAAIPLLQARVGDLIPRYKDTIHYWDVLNEANAAAGHTPPNGEGAWIKRDGPAPVVETALSWARAAAPPGVPETFLYNDFDLNGEKVLLTQLQKDGKLPDAVGIQSHMHGGIWPMTQVWATCETLARFGRPIHFTETTILSGPKTDAGWLTTPAGEAQQADYVTQFYTLLFSHPSVRAITWWDFSDLNAWQDAPAGFLRKDMTPKPVYTRLRDLIHTQWWTKAAGKTSRQGAFPVRVFYGEYQVTVTDPKGRTATQTVSFPESAPPLSVTVRLP